MPNTDQEMILRTQQDPPSHRGGTSDGLAEIETPSTVQRALASVFHRDGQIQGLRRLSGGASRETWKFRLLSVDGYEDLILRRDPLNGPERFGSMSLEVRAIRAARAAGVPTPEIVAHGDDFGGTGTAFFVSRFIEGETLGSRIVRSPALARARAAFATDCGGALALIHRIDPSAISGLESHHDLEPLERGFDELGRPSVAIALMLRLLRDHPPTAHPNVVLHGDFRNGNLIIGPDGLRAVLDWELVAVGDPVMDLGWLCTRAWSFGGAHPVGGIGSYEELLDGYAAVAGWRPDTRDVLWWQAVGSIRWALACLRAAARYVDGSRRTIDTAALARRVSENERDALDLVKAMGW